MHRCNGCERNERTLKKVRRKTKKTASGRYNIKKLAVYMAVLLAGMYFVYAMIWQQSMISQKDKELEALRQSVDAANAETERLKLEVESLNDPEYIERIAREELGLVRPNERVFIDSNKSEDNTSR